jgi:hypothetical protein
VGSVTAQDITIVEMRYAAILLERFNDLYEGRMYGWTPESLRYEADYLEANP